MVCREYNSARCGYSYVEVVVEISQEFLGAYGVFFLLALALVNCSYFLVGAFQTLKNPNFCLLA